MEETYKGYPIRYDERLGEFIVTIGDSSYKNSNLATMKKYIDRLDKKDFKRVAVIIEGYHEMEDAVVTSYPEGQSKTYQECWISYKDKRHYHSRTKININKVFLDNQGNREILAKVKEKKNVIEIIKKEVIELKDTLETYRPDV